MSLHVLHDSTGSAARALLALQNLDENQRVRHPNATILAVLLLLQLQPYHRELLPKYRGYDFQWESEQVEKADRLLSAARLQGDDGTLLHEELEFTARLLGHAARLGRQRFATPNLEVSEIPASERGRLAEELADLSERYRRLWLGRSRPGGLSDSAGRLLALQESYLLPRA